MQYLNSAPFTIPATTGKISQQEWDRIFLSSQEFARKYQEKTTWPQMQLISQESKTPR